MPALLKASADPRIGGDDREKQEAEADIQNVEHYAPPIMGVASRYARDARELRRRDCLRSERPRLQRRGQRESQAWLRLTLMSRSRFGGRQRGRRDAVCARTWHKGAIRISASPGESLHRRFCETSAPSDFPSSRSDFATNSSPGAACVAAHSAMARLSLGSEQRKRRKS